MGWASGPWVTREGQRETHVHLLLGCDRLQSKGQAAPGLSGSLDGPLAGLPDSSWALSLERQGTEAAAQPSVSGVDTLPGGLTPHLHHDLLRG